MIASALHAAATKGNIAARTFILERRDPANWGRNASLTVAAAAEHNCALGVQNVPAPKTVGEFSPQQFTAYYAETKARVFRMTDEQ